MNCNKKFSRRDFLGVLGGGVAALAFFPRMAFAGTNEIVAIRTGIQPGNKTRLVIETTARPEYSLSYPEGKLVIRINANGSPKPKLVDGGLVKKIDFGRDEIVAHLKKTIAPIPKSQTMMFEPTDKNRYRLVLDFAAGTNVDKTKIAAETAIAPKTAAKKPTIVIDPGHGGKDPGAIGIGGTKEKDIVLSVSKKLFDRLKNAGYNVSMTRRDDTFLNLDTRAAIAEKKNADLFVSIHANANPKRTIKGFSVYTLSKTASDAEAQKLADAENAADKIGIDEFGGFGHEVRVILSALQQQMVAEDSDVFARNIMRSTRAAGINDVDKDPRSAGFAVLKSTVPGCLVELGHLSHRDEEKLLRNGDYQSRLAGALTTAIGNYKFES
jgi:N-acetylmuramoyl-L-alanine amidase